MTLNDIQAYFSKNWESIQQNLVAGVILLLADILLTYLVFNRIINRNENRKWLPTRRIVVSQLVKTYGWLFNASHHIMRWTSETPAFDAYEASISQISHIQKNFQRLQLLVDINSRALDVDLAATISTIMENTEIVIKKLTFFAQVHNPEYGALDIVGEPPIKELEVIEANMVKVKRTYPDLISNSSLTPSDLLPIAQLEVLWTSCGSTHENLHFDWKNYQSKVGKQALMFDVDAIKNLKLRPEHGAQILVYWRD